MLLEAFILHSKSILCHVKLTSTIYIPPPIPLLTRSLPTPIILRRIGSEVDRRKCGHVREEIGGMITFIMGVFVNIPFSR